ncbi:WSC domain-containing protein ARB_07870-like [Patiria miniata]|uniref:Uncharacterized protein n=1 Tax=Patiria miniata TaxID=46514 RepID=A0A913ZGK5_PATMI|nr:WSC domain-containing protein ARB_07870-like [Patiria miniata]
MVRVRRRDEGRTGVMLVMLLVLIAQLPSVLVFSGLGQLPDYIGCYKDNTGDRALRGSEVKDESSMSWQWCMKNCINYNYMGLEFGDECFCGDNSDYYRHDNGGTDCSTTCEGNSGQPGYLGCYEDSIYDRALQGSEEKDESSMSWQWCMSKCKNYNYMGLEFGNECYCGDNSDYGKHGNGGTGCSLTCEGNSGETCGGSDRIEVYRARNGLCYKPGQPSHGSYSVSRPYSYNLGNYEYAGASLRYTCDRGYYFPAKPPTVTCVIGKTWNPAYSTCQVYFA